jgi:ATP-dependent DNA helicase RecG
MTESHTQTTLATPAQYLPGVGLMRAGRLAKIGLRTAGDLLFCFPRDYEFPAPPSRIDQLREGQSASLVGTIVDAEIVSRTPGRSVFGAVIENETSVPRFRIYG